MISERVNRVRVRTPEGVVFAFPLAGPIARMLAWLVDFLVIMAISWAVGIGLSFLRVLSVDVAGGVGAVVYFVVTTGYGILLESRWRGQTIGKRMLHLRVVDEEGLPLRFSQVVLRNLARAIDFLPGAYLVGGATMMLSPRAQRLGDIAAGTIVVRHRRVREPDIAQLLQGKYNSLREQPHLAARLRQQTPPELAAAAVSALLRRDALEPDARVALFAELAEAFRLIAPFPPEIAGAMPDEVYVRNVVDIVHGERRPDRPAADDKAPATANDVERAAAQR